MSTMERLFVEIFDRKSRIERQLHQQLESYGESLACNVIADGKQPPPWLLELVPAAAVCLGTGEFRQPSSTFRNTKRKACSAISEFIQGTLPRNDSNFESSIDDFVIAPTVDKKNKSPHAVEETQSACSKDKFRPTNLLANGSETHHASQGSKKIFSYVDTFENKASESVGCHDGSKEGEEPAEALQRLCGCDIIALSDAAGVKFSCDETMSEFKGSNIDLPRLPYVVEDDILCKDDYISSLAKDRTSTIPHVEEEFLSVCSMDEVRFTNVIPFESQIVRTSSGAEKLFSNVDKFENKACESLVHCDVSEEGKEPNNVTLHLHRCDITGISDTASVKSSCDETIRSIPDFNGSNIDTAYTAEVNISRDADIPSLSKERVSVTPHAVEEILSVCYRDEIRTSNLMPCESEIHHASHTVEKLFSQMDTVAKQASQSIGHHDGFDEDEEPYDASQRSDSCDVTISDIADVKPSCDETMLEFDGSKVDLPYAPEDNIVFKVADIPSLASERVSTTPHIAQEFCSACSKDEVRMANFVPVESEIHSASQCGVDAIKNKASESLCRHDGSEEGEEPYDEPYRCDITSISDTVGAQFRYDENMPEFERFCIDLPYEEDNIVCKDADIPSLAKERAFALEQLRQSRVLLTPRSKPSIMNRINIISDGFNSSPLSILQNLDLGFSLEHNNPDIKHFTASSSIKLMDMLCNNVSQLDGTAFESSLSTSSARFSSELQNLPLTPPAIKFSHGRWSGKRSSSSVKVCSNPELICFRIDENSSTTEDNADVVKVGYSTHRASTRNMEVSTNSKPLSDVTSLYQDDTCFLSNFKEFAVRDSLESVNSEIAVRDSLESVNSDAASSLGFVYAGRESNIESKENLRYTDAIKELRTATGTVNKMSERPRVSCRSSDRIRNYQSIGKGCKPSNILSSISSFIPQIQKKQQQTLPLQRKKDIKVKALEAAEAAKRLEDQMKIEREKRKAAVKLEREKMRQENAKLLKLKQEQKEEERRKKEDVAARKRQREAEEKKVKNKKRRCIEETRTLPRDNRDKLRCEKVEKDIRQKAIDEKQKGGKQRNNGGQKKFEREGDATENQMAVEMQHCAIQLAATNTVLGDDKIQALEASDEHKSLEKGVAGSNALRETIEETVSSTQISLELQSYEMSPYQTSDDEDMEEDRRCRKYIPRWARGESLGEIILANQQLDPKDIFSRKRSFSVSQVLTSRVLWRRPLK